MTHQTPTPTLTTLTHAPGLRIVGWMAALLACGTCWAAETTQQQYARTIEALQQRYADEVRAHRKYAAFADKALAEDYPNIAHLFEALSASETIHARNFRMRLADLGVTVEPAPGPDFEVSSTKANIRNATAVEVDEIDRKYPEILRDIAPENHGTAIRDLTYAWQAEMQHRDLIKRIQSAVDKWFGLLVARIEGGHSEYYVCQICGSTLTEMPAQQCPICAHPLAHYREIPGFRAPDGGTGRD